MLALSIMLTEGNVMSTDDFFDFGFTAVDESELQAVQQTAAKADNAEQSR